MSGLGDIVRRREGVVARDTAKGAILVDMYDGDCFEMNRVGALFWASIEAPQPLSKICEVVERRFSIERAVVERDLLALVEALAQADLVEVRPASASHP